MLEYLDGISDPEHVDPATCPIFKICQNFQLMIDKTNKESISREAVSSFLDVWRRLLKYRRSPALDSWFAAVGAATANLHSVMVGMALADDLGSDGGSFEMSHVEDDSDISGEDNEDDGSGRIIGNEELASILPSKRAPEGPRTSRKRRATTKSKLAGTSTAVAAQATDRHESSSRAIPRPSSPAIVDSATVQDTRFPEVCPDGVPIVIKMYTVLRLLAAEHATNHEAHARLPFLRLSRKRHELWVRCLFAGTASRQARYYKSHQCRTRYALRSRIAF
jgi:hypothetical protein